MANNIKDLRLAAGLTQKELAQKTGIAEPDVSRVERGLLPLHPGWAKRIAEALLVEEEDLTRVENKRKRK